MFVGNMLAPMVSGQAHLGALIADFAGMRGIEAYTTEAAGASGGAALRAGYLAVKSGFVDTVLVVGVEKFTDKVGDEIESAMATSLDSDYEAVQGLTPVSQAALLMRRYLHEYEVPRAAFGIFPLIAHVNGANNRYAMFQKAIRPEIYNGAGMVSDPLNMFDAAPDADGAAAVILTRADLLPASQSYPRVRIAGSSVSTDTLALHDRPDPLDFRAARLSVERAKYQAGIELSQIDFFELFDAYSIFAALSLEAAGFTERGQGWNEPVPLPIATMGGLKARGNPWGATGVYQAVEAVLQLRGQAGESQIPGAKFGLTQCLGGPASTAITNIFERID
ncbi:MAG TPA: thiolase domain-containing protein [Chloroflexi bacterium]|nr:thiolase domain-containing protein [Chloroflexota bacterium]